jgi:hypothetical protein
MLLKKEIFTFLERSSINFMMFIMVLENLRFLLPDKNCHKVETSKQSSILTFIQNTHQL